MTVAPGFTVACPEGRLPVAAMSVSIGEEFPHHGLG